MQNDLQTVQIPDFQRRSILPVLRRNRRRGKRNGYHSSDDPRSECGTGAVRHAGSHDESGCPACGTACYPPCCRNTADCGAACTAADRFSANADAVRRAAESRSAAAAVRYAAASVAVRGTAESPSAAAAVWYAAAAVAVRGTAEFRSAAGVTVRGAAESRSAAGSAVRTAGNQTGSVPFDRSAGEYGICRSAAA